MTPQLLPLFFKNSKREMFLPPIGKFLRFSKGEIFVVGTNESDIARGSKGPFALCDTHFSDFNLIQSL